MVLRRWSFVLFGLASALLYAFIGTRYPLMRGLLVPRGTWATLVHVSWGALAAHIGVYALLSALYVLALRAAVRRPPPIPLIVAAWLLCALALLGAYPGGESHDVFDYTFRGRMLAELGASPLAITPEHFRRAPYYRYISWHGHVDTYGPLWEYASATVAALVRVALRAGGAWPGGHPGCPASARSCAALAAYVTGYRLLAIALAGLAGALIYGIVRRISPAHAPAALLAWLWSPLQLIATALGAHNDSLLLPLLLVALSLAQRQRWLPALLVLALATHVKLTALLLAPPLLIWMARRAGLWRASAAALLALAMSAPLSWLLYAPLGGWETLPRMLHERGLYLAGSPANVLYRWLYDRQGWGAPQARTAATGGATLLFGLAALAPLGRLWRSAEHAPGDEPLWRAALGVTLAYLLLGCFWFQHWYLLWALAPAALLPHGAAARTLLPWYGFGALSANVAENMLGALPGLAPGRLELAAVVVAITFMPLACAAAVLAVRWRHAVRSTHTPEAARLAAPRGRRRRHRRIARRRRSRVWGGSGW